MSRKAYFAVGCLGLLLISASAGLAQIHAGKMDTDGHLSPGEIPNPRINYNNYPQRPAYNPPVNPGAGDCAAYTDRNLQRPRVDLGRVKQSGGFFGDKVKVRGSVEGVCLIEAGLFEDGQKVQTIPINTTTQFTRYEFEVKTRLDKRPEIRVYAVNGERDIVEVGQEE